MRFPGSLGTSLLPSYWVVCDGCGGVVVSENSLFPERCHEGWRMPADCDETVIERIIKE